MRATGWLCLAVVPWLWACPRGFDAPDAGPTAASCLASERPSDAGSCVPVSFDEVDLAPAAPSDFVASSSGGLDYARGTLLVLLKDPARPGSDLDGLLQAQGGTRAGGIPFAGLHRARFTVSTEAELDAKAQALKASPLVDDAFRDEVVAGASAQVVRDRGTDLEGRAPLDYWESYGTRPGELTPRTAVGPAGLWAYERIALSAAWDAIYRVNPTVSAVAVAVLDDGVHRSPVFDPVRFVEEYDVRSYGAFGDDELHGTAVASIIGAPNDGKGMNGILSGLACVPYGLVPITVTGGDPDAGRVPVGWTDAGVTPVGAAYSSIMLGTVVAVRSGARVVNMSIASRFGRPTITASLAKIFQRVASAAPRVLFVAGAGNWAEDATGSFLSAAARPLPDGGTPNVMSVAAIGRDGARARWGPGSESNYDKDVAGTVTIAAPGTDVLASRPNGELTMFGGTSAATPMVSGVAALVLSLRPELSGAELRQVLVDSAAPLPDPTISGKVLDAAAAVERVLASLPAGRAGAGKCRAAADNVCPVGQTCSWCIRGTMAFQMPSNYRGGSVPMAGQLDVAWFSDTRLDDITFALYGTRPDDGGLAVVNWHESGGHVLRSEVDRAHVVVENVNRGDFTDGTPGGPFDALPHLQGVRDTFSASFGGAQVAGQLEVVADGGFSAQGRFTGTYQPKNDAGFVRCPF